MLDVVNHAVDLVLYFHEFKNIIVCVCVCVSTIAYVFGNWQKVHETPLGLISPGKVKRVGSSRLMI